MFFSCNREGEEGTYGLSHAVDANDLSQTIPTPPKIMMIDGDSVYVFDYEPYIPVKKGIISKNMLIFAMKETTYFKIKEDYLVTFKDTVNYYWVKEK